MLKFLNRFLLFIGLLIISFQAFAQADSVPFFAPSPSFNPGRFKTIVISESALYTVNMITLYHLWYSGYPLEKFHQFDDNAEWLQMDKVGHGISSYYTSVLQADLLKWTGVSPKKSVIYGALPALLFESTIEVFDGFAPQWGFSTGDMIANVSGCGLAVAQGLAWNEQRFKLKFSFHQSDFAKMRPNILGSNLGENIIKDYNGQTYWLNGNIASFLSKDTKFPKWLGLAFGYGANGMISGDENPADTNDPTIPYIKRYRQYYLSLDIDVTKIKMKSKLAHFLFSSFGFIRIPAPALEFNHGGIVKFYPLYF